MQYCSLVMNTVIHLRFVRLSSAEKLGLLKFGNTGSNKNNDSN